MQKVSPYYNEVFYTLNNAKSITRGKFVLACYDEVSIEEYKPTVQWFIERFLQGKKCTVR